MCSTQNFHGYSLESPHRTSLIREAQLPPAQSHTACAVTHSAAATSEPSSRIPTITCASEMDLLRPARVLISFTSKPTHLGGGTWARGDTLALRGRSQYGELSKVALSSYKKKKRERERIRFCVSINTKYAIWQMVSIVPFLKICSHVTSPTPTLEQR